MATARSGATGNREYLHREVVPFAAMVSLQCIGVGLNTLYKLAANDGMSRHVFIAYAYAVAALLLLPSPFLSRRYEPNQVRSHQFMTIYIRSENCLK